jgi:hypothetical protein
MLPVVFTTAQQNIYIVSRAGGCDPAPTGQFAHQCPLCRRADLAGAMPPSPNVAPSQLANPPLPTNTPRASRLARPRFNCPPARPPERPTPPPRQLAPHAPYPGARSTAGRPLARDWGTEHRLWRVVAWASGCRGGLPRGSPCQGPHRKIPRRPGTHTTQRSYSHPCSIPQPRTVGPRSLLHRLTDPIWGVKVQNAVKVARNCCGGRFLYGAGPCTTKTPYKVGHLFEELSDILGT